MKYEKSDHDIGVVVGQEPEAGSSAAPDDSVDLKLSNGEEKDDDDEDERGPPGLRERDD